MKKIISYGAFTGFILLSIGFLGTTTVGRKYRGKDISEEDIKRKLMPYRISFYSGFALLSIAGVALMVKEIES